MGIAILWVLVGVTIYYAHSSGRTLREELTVERVDIEITDKAPVEFYCNCTKDRVEKALISIGKKDLQELIDEGKEIEMNCHFCNTNYVFSVEELKEILKKVKR